MTQIQIKSNPDHSSIRLSRATLPPTPAASLLVQAESARATGDLVFTMQDQPEVVGEVAKVLNIDPLRVRIHVAVVNGTFNQAVFIDGRIRLGSAAKTALNRVDLFKLYLNQFNQELTLELESI
jgi:CO/xanthine dehydrogenase Mo-binding subunit